MSVSLDQLRTLVAVSRTGSFTAAADELGLSQPAVSNQMKSLEDELGYALFDRRGRHIEVTPRARGLAAEVAGHIDCLSNAVSGFRAPEQGKPRLLHVAGPADYLSIRVAPLLAGLRERGVELRLTMGDSSRLLVDLASGLFDMVISTSYPHVKGVSATPLTDEEYVLVAAPGWSRMMAESAGSAESQEAALGRIPVVACSEELRLTSLYWGTVFSKGVEGLHIAAVIPDLRAVTSAVEHGLGMSVLPDYLARDGLSRGSLVRLLDPEPAPLNTLHMAIRDGLAHKDPAIRILQEALLVDARGWDADAYAKESMVATI